MNLSRTALVFAASALALGACSSPSVPASPSDSDGFNQVVSPSAQGKVRAPDVEGTVVSVATSDGAVSVVFDAFDGFSDFDDATIVFAAGDVPAGVEGDPLDPTTLKAGDQVRVWVTECSESFPVTCTGERVETYLP